MQGQFGVRIKEPALNTSQVFEVFFIYAYFVAVKNVVTSVSYNNYVGNTQSVLNLLPWFCCSTSQNNCIILRT